MAIIIVIIIIMIILIILIMPDGGMTSLRLNFKNS